MVSSAPSMSDYIDKSPEFGKAILLDQSQPGGPTLPDLKKMTQALQAQGREVIDQSAGCISLVDQPLNPEFLAWILEYRGKFKEGGPDSPLVFPYNMKGIYTHDQNYDLEYPRMLGVVAEDIGITTPYEATSTVAGRAALGGAFFGWQQENNRRNLEEGTDKKAAIILPPLAWSGYEPLAKMMGFELIYAPAVSERGLNETNEGLEAGITLAKAKGFRPIAAISINSSNPTGETTDPAETKKEVGTCAEERMSFFMDGFYSPIARKGQKETLGLEALQAELTPKELSVVQVLVGETKVTDSQKKTAQLFNLAPDGHNEKAHRLMGDAITFKKTYNLYARPDEALTAAALHSFPGGIHEAMGPRYQSLEAARQAMRTRVGALIPLVGADSFYSTVAMVDEKGETLVRDTEGRPVTDPKKASATLVDRFGLVQAPGGLFRPGAHKLARATAAVTVETVNRIEGIIQQMLDEAERHG
ncbi:MAG: aminotransferase class I/II-fold pyridoxal phosphate-dependent enzyme [Candidatus Peregrinibacteria bacterium]|nr:aminotransferase class I/II-fold pyridoxal phosphate-dependent enzyme [Candidatus Peregrinibacteria bacterium]